MEELTMERTAEMIKEQKDFFFTGKTLDLDFRIKTLLKLKEAIKRNEQAVMEGLQKDLGKSEFESYATEIGFVYDSISYIAKNLKKWAKVKRARTPLHQFGAKSLVYSEPYGVTLVIGPYNYPFQLVIEPLVGAIAAGNTAVMKPAVATPNVNEAIKKIISETFEENYVRVVEGSRLSTSALINSKFDYIFFTGSVPVGKVVAEAAGKNLVPYTLELGGKSPCIVDETADLDVAAKRIAWGKFMNAGQTCVAPDYLVVHKNVKQKLIEKLKYTLREFYGEEPKNSPDFCRIINQRQMSRLVDIIKRDENKIACGGQYDENTLYIAPTVIDNANWDDAAMEDEIFGPILPVMEYEEIDQVIRMVNDRPKPLALYIFTSDKQVEKKVLTLTSSGGGCVNDTVSHVASPYIPFGGVGNAGIGSYHGKQSFDTFSHKKSIMKKSTRIKLSVAFPPYGDKLKLVRKIMK